MSSDGMAERGSSGELWMSWPHALLGWSFKEKERVESREEKRRRGEDRGLRGSSPSEGAAKEEQEALDRMGL